MKEQLGEDMYKLVSRLFPFNRSLTGEGVRKTLTVLKEYLPELKIHEVPTGSKAFDWSVPKEWNVVEAWVENENGLRVIDFKQNNLHLVGYSIAVDKIIDKSELENHLHSLPQQPDAIPYVTSYYTPNWGFCIKDKERKSLGNGPFHVYIDSNLFEGHMSYGELKIDGESPEEILLSTYICHPSMANNELSGPVVATYLGMWLKTLPNRRYSYRIAFLPETIGSIYYISKNWDELKQVKAGWVLTCMGDNRVYSYVPTRKPNTLTNKISLKALSDTDSSFIEYSWLDRGSDERQYNAPNVDIPIGSIMRSKYGAFPEYHSSLDNLELVTPLGLHGSLKVMKLAITIAENNKFWKIRTYCEPQLGKRGLYPNTSIKGSADFVRDQMNVISYLDGKTELLDVAIICKISFNEALVIINHLRDANLIEEISF